MAENEAETPPIPKYPSGLRARGKALWDELHGAGDFSGCPETLMVAEEACHLVDEITRQRRLVRAAGADTRVQGSQKQPVSMPEIADLRQNQSLFLAMLKSLRMPDEDEGLSRSDLGKLGARGRWG